MCYHVVSSVLSEYEKNSPSGGLGPAPSIQCRKITLGGYTHTMVQASLTVQTAADGRSYHLAHHTRRWIRPITRPPARGPRGSVPASHALTNLTRYSAVTHTVVQGRDTHATDCCRWAFSRSIVHMSSGNRPSLLACAPGMMPQGASKRTRGLLFLLVCSWIGRSLHFGPTARVRWYRQPLLSVGIAH